MTLYSVSILMLPDPFPPLISQSSVHARRLLLLHWKTSREGRGDKQSRWQAGSKHCSVWKEYGGGLGVRRHGREGTSGRECIEPKGHSDTTWMECDLGMETLQAMVGVGGHEPAGRPPQLAPSRNGHARQGCMAAPPPSDSLPLAKGGCGAPLLEESAYPGPTSRAYSSRDANNSKASAQTMTSRPESQEKATGLGLVLARFAADFSASLRKREGRRSTYSWSAPASPDTVRSAIFHLEFRCSRILQ